MRNNRSLIFKLISISFLVLVAGCNGNPKIFGDWKGTLTTEAINVGLEIRIVSLASGDSGDWKFIGDEGQTLNQGDIQAWPPAGEDVVFILLQSLENQNSASSATLYGKLSPGGNKINGVYATFGSGAHGGFELTR